VEEKRERTEPMESNAPGFTVSSIEEKVCIIFCKHTLLPLDNCLCVAKPLLSAYQVLFTLLTHHGISRLPGVESDKLIKNFNPYPIGYFYIDSAEVRMKGKPSLFVAIDCPSKFV
jgi:hypothetical protein